MALKTLITSGVAAAALVGATFAATAPAQAQRGFHHGGGVHMGGFRGGGFRGGGFRGGRGWGGGGWGYAGAGIATGLALGALAASSYPYGYGYGYPGYGYYGATYGGECFWQPRRVWGPYGWHVRNVEVCY